MAGPVSFTGATDSGVCAATKPSSATDPAATDHAGKYDVLVCKYLDEFDQSDE